MLKDISEFVKGDKIKSFSGIEYEVISINFKSTIRKVKLKSGKFKRIVVKDFYSEISDLETDSISNATHGKNKCFIKIKES